MQGCRLLAFVFLGICTTVAHARFVPATDPSISWSGRWLTMGTERHATSACQRFRFLTNAIACRLELAQAGVVEDNAHLSVRIDGGAWIRHTPAGLTEDSVLLYEGAATGMHTVEVVVTAMYRGSPFIARPGRFMLKGVTVPDGATMSPLPYPDHRLVLLGDSTTCGFLFTTDSDKMLGMDAGRSVGVLLSDWTGRDVSVIAVPGIGFNKPADYMPGVTAVKLLRFNAEAIAWKPSPASDVFINLGALDRLDTTSDEILLPLVQGYLAEVRVLFPRARIWLLRPFNGNRQNVLASAVKAFDDPSCRYVDTTGWLDLRRGYDTSETVHPNASGYMKYARRLMELLAKETDIAGDLDGDGLLTLSDAAAVARAAAGVP